VTEHHCVTSTLDISPLYFKQAMHTGWRRGVVVERQIRDREVAGTSLGRALWRKNSGQVSHTYG